MRSPHSLPLEDPLARALAPIVLGRTGLSSGGFPYLDQKGYELLRDTVPHVLGSGPRVLAALEALERALAVSSPPPTEGEWEGFRRGARVVRAVVDTAAVTAPCDLWLLRFVLGTLKRFGLVERLLAGERVDPAECEVEVSGAHVKADPRELEADLTFVLSRGYLLQDHESRFVAPSHPRAVEVLRRIEPLPPALARSLTPGWTRALSGLPLARGELEALRRVGRSVPRRTDSEPTTWIATPEEIELGFRLLPLVLALRVSGKGSELLEARGAAGLRLAPLDPGLDGVARAVLTAAGVLDNDRLTPVGRRVLERGAGPMGIIEAYHPYMERLDDILIRGPGEVWVVRGANIAASQDANRRTFLEANAALDRFCEETGFQYRVFIEHAIGRGEATRQRFARSGVEALQYFGADLEDAAIDACLEEQRKGRLPGNMRFIRQADIGDPRRLVDALREAGADPRGAVMIVGNGFHEVRDQTDERMVEVFRGYEQAGILLLFTEENALSVDDLLSTAWNTYHAGFRYVHEKSGQGLRPADPAPTPRYGRPLRASWSECATRSGYVRADRFSSRSRTIYPTPPRAGHNPSISVNHFFVPRRIAEALGL